MLKSHKNKNDICRFENWIKIYVESNTEILNTIYQLKEYDSLTWSFVCFFLNEV